VNRTTRVGTIPLPKAVIGLQTADLASSEALGNGMHSGASIMDFEYELQILASKEPYQLKLHLATIEVTLCLLEDFVDGSSMQTAWQPIREHEKSITVIAATPYDTRKRPLAHPSTNKPKPLPNINSCPRVMALLKQTRRRESAASFSMKAFTLRRLAWMK